MKFRNMTLSVILGCILIGILAGVLSGSVGVGGGIIMVPLAVLFLGYTQHQAQGLSLAVLSIPVTLVAAYTYHTNGSPIDWRYAVIIAPTFILGAYLGAKLSVQIDQDMMKRIFGIILLIVGIKLVFFSGIKA